MYFYLKIFFVKVVGTAFIVIGQNFLHEVSEMPEEFMLIELFPIFAIYLGSSICIITFIGCLASLKRSENLIKCYAGLMVILCTLQITFSSYYLAQKDFIEDKSTEIVIKVWNNHIDQPEVMDGVQLIGQCCGLHSFEDFDGGELPASCCGYEDPDNSCDSEGAYKEGCISGFPDFYMNNACWIVYYGYLIAAVELGAVTLACFVKFGDDDDGYKKEDLG